MRRHERAVPPGSSGQSGRVPLVRNRRRRRRHQRRAPRRGLPDGVRPAEPGERTVPGHVHRGDQPAVPVVPDHAGAHLPRPRDGRRRSRLLGLQDDPHPAGQLPVRDPVLPAVHAGPGHQRHARPDHAVGVPVSGRPRELPPDRPGDAVDADVAADDPRLAPGNAPPVDGVRRRAPARVRRRRDRPDSGLGADRQHQ